MPEHHARCFFLHMIQIELLTDFTVIAFCSFFQTLQIGIQLFLVSPGCAIDTLQHFVFCITTPVGTGGFLQFEVVAETHIRNMRATAHINIFFMMIQTRFVITGNIFIQNGNLVGFTTGFKYIAGFLPAHCFFNDVVVFLCQFQHPRFQRLNVFFCQHLIQIYIVVKAVINNWSDSHFGLWPQLLDCVPQQMRTGVAQNFQTFLIFGCDNRKRGVSFDELARIN